MKNNLIINGSGEYPGGTYDKISIRGEGTILNQVESSVFHVYGTCEARENLSTGSAKILGEAKIKGNVEAEETLIMGSMAIDGKAILKKMKVFGALEVGESLSGNEATIKGSISVKGDVEYETFESSGGFDIKGLLNADTIKIALRYGESKAEEIGGGNITVKRKRNSFIPFVGEEGSLAAKVIEGDDVYLENTRAEVVRGNKVNIGPGCQIGLVEYTNDFSENANSTVKMTKKIGGE
ncbi:cytoplasmic protein [Neobacillus massiliamazoniensis]|uniref:Cytoplasmic protein n=1 Tax=Neobacillus massiliamazoniensis TaxID=1499688 RepID=A0A0U1P5I8_9BACI|nr:cytoplasmic protein [Neobacillus massiliamazoniensis]CRK85401.1 cytoplasmic protein [Neobacillus massiliamazoniensis]